jgi:YD repeat-containing protein
VGRITRKTEDGGAPVDTYYQYDMAGRLYRVCDDDLCNSVRSEYQYDLNSNRTGGFNDVSGTITATYDSQDRLLTYNGTTYTYTANGELKTKTDNQGTTTYDYDALGNLRQVVLHAEDPNEAQVIDYVIDGQNRRIGKKPEPAHREEVERHARAGVPLREPAATRRRARWTRKRGQPLRLR